MSLSTLSTIAVQRDTAAPRRSIRKPTTPDEASSTEQSGYAAVLVAAIPSEPLALYTFVTGGIVAQIGPGEDQWLPLRWTVYGATLVFIAAFLGAAYMRGNPTQRRRFPWAETTAALVAFATWGLVMPGSPLSAKLSGDAAAIWPLVITAGGCAVLLVLGTQLKAKAKG